MFDGNRVTAHTRSRYPIFQSPMTWIARAPLVSAVSAAGGMGLLENSIRDLSVTQREFTAIRAATNQPFGVNLPVRYLQMDPKEEAAIIDWLLGQGIHFVTTSAGDPTRYTRMLKDAGVTMGTRFVASFESPVHLNYKQAIVAAPITGTSLTDNPPRARSRGLRTPYAVEVAEGKRERLPRDATLDMLYVNGDVDGERSVVAPQSIPPLLHIKISNNA